MIPYLIIIYLLIAWGYGGHFVSLESLNKNWDWNLVWQNLFYVLIIWPIIFWFVTLGVIGFCVFIKIVDWLDKSEK